jgi:hypothetical protein
MIAKKSRRQSKARLTPLPSPAPEVGYGKPPAEHRFNTGQSGNPEGRPKGAKSHALILRALLNRKIEVRESGRARKITVFEAILLRFAEDALNGNTKTAAFLFDRYERNEEIQASGESSQLSTQEKKVLDDFARRIQDAFGDDK